MMERLEVEEESGIEDCNTQSDYTDYDSEDSESLDMTGELDSLDAWENLGEPTAARWAAEDSVFHTSKRIAEEMAVLEEHEVDYVAPMRNGVCELWSLSEVKQKWPTFLQRYTRDPEATIPVLNHMVCGLLPIQFRPERWSSEERRVSAIIRKEGLTTVMARVLLCEGMQLQGTFHMYVDRYTAHSNIYNRRTKYCDFWEEMYKY